MVLLRSFGRTCLFIAFCAAALDGMQALATPRDGIRMWSFADHIARFGADALTHFEASISGVMPSLVWSSLVEPLLVLPMTMVFSALGVIFYMAGYKRPAIEPQLG